MNIKGRPRGGPRQLAQHLGKDENETVRLIGIHGLAARDVEGALYEMAAQGAALRTDKTLYHGIISPERGHDFAMSEADWDLTRRAYLEGMGFQNQPYVEIEHEKFGKDGVLRLHRHIIVGLTDLDHNRAIRTDHNYRKHEEIARHVERQLGHEHVQGAHVDRFGVKRPERTATTAEQRQAERGAVSAKDAKTLGAEVWRAADSGKAIAAALESHGWLMARGDKQRADGGAYFMAIDPRGGVHELRRMVPVKAAELYARVADTDAASLPSVQQAKEQQRARQPEREAARAAERAKRAPDSSPHLEHRSGSAMIELGSQAHAEIARADAQRREPSAAPTPPGQTNARTGGAESGRQTAVAPLSKTAGEIRLAWKLSRSPEELKAGLAERGMTLARATPDEAARSHRSAAYLKAIGKYAVEFEAGEILIVNRFGNAVRLDQRTTGDLRAEIDKRLAMIDAASLPNVTDAKAAMVAAEQQRREARRQEVAARRRLPFEAAREAARHRNADTPPAMPSERVTGGNSLSYQQKQRVIHDQVVSRQQDMTAARSARYSNANKAERAAEKTAGLGAAILGRGVLSVLAGLLKMFDLFPAKPPSPEQQERNYWAREEQRAADQIANVKDARAREASRQIADDQERSRQRRMRGRSDDYGRERERER